MSGKQTRHAQLLLLLEQQARRAVVETVLQVLPQAHLAECFLDGVVQHAFRELLPRRVDAQAEYDVLVDRDRQRVRPLEHHADGFAQLHQRHLGPVDVLAQDADLARGAHVPVALVDTIEATQERRLAAPARPDQRGDEPLADGHRHFLERLEASVPQAQAARLDRVAARGFAHPNTPLT